MHFTTKKHFSGPMRLNQSAGFSLIELMIAMAVTGIFTAGMYSVFQAQVKGQRSQDVALEMNQNLRAAVGMIAADIRMAGCNPRNLDSVDAEIRTANVSELRITMDIRGDNPGDPPDADVADPGEDIRYGINAEGNLGRDVGNTGILQPIALNCPADGLTFVYLDAEGNPFIPANQDERDDIRSVRVTAAVLSPPGYEARRFELTETIFCRNL